MPRLSIKTIQTKLAAAQEALAIAQAQVDDFVAECATHGIEPLTGQWLVKRKATGTAYGGKAQAQDAGNTYYELQDRQRNHLRYVPVTQANLVAEQVEAGKHLTKLKQQLKLATLTREVTKWQQRFENAGGVLAEGTVGNGKIDWQQQMAGIEMMDDESAAEETPAPAKKKATKKRTRKPAKRTPKKAAKGIDFTTFNRGIDDLYDRVFSSAS